MNMRTLALFLALIPVFSLAETPDLTSSLEFVANPLIERWPNSEGARGMIDLQFYRGDLYNGGGEVESNPGATWIQSINPYTKKMTFEFAPGTEAIANYLVTSWGDLVTPSQDPHEGDANVGHVFSRTPEGKWSVFKSVGGSLPAGSSSVANNTHNWDMTEYDGRVFVADYNLHWSTNHLKTFEICSPMTSAYHRISYKYALRVNNKDQVFASTINTLRRQVQLMNFGTELFAIGNTVVQPQLMSDTTVNQQELYRYDSSTKKFVELSQRVSTIYPNLTTNDYKLVGRNLTLLATNKYAYVWMRAWHCMPFKGRVLYVGCYDTPPYGQVYSPFEDKIAWTSYPLPLMGCSASIGSSRNIVATRLNFGGDKENYPWDFTVNGDTVYTLTSKFNATTKMNHHIVWKSTDGVNFSEVLSFDYHQNMISLEYRDGWFYFGVGVKKATLGYSYNSTASEAGAIYRVFCPQEPVRVIASTDSLTIREGHSADVTFSLSAAPASNLTLRVGATLASTRFVTDKTSLTFTPSNWSTPQTVTISLTDNDTVDAVYSGTVACGGAGFDDERGEFCCPEATSGYINVSAEDDEVVPPPNGEIRTTDDFFCAMQFPDGDYRLMNDLDLTGSLFTTIDEFSGTLNGNGHVLSGLGAGPFCKVNRGSVSDLTIDGKGTTAKVIGCGIFCNELAGGAFTNVTMKGYTVQAASPDTYFGLFAAQITGKCEFVNCTMADDCKVSQAGNHDCVFGSFAAKFTVANSSGVLARFLNCTNNAVIAASDNYRTGSGGGGFLGVISGCTSASAPEIVFENCANNGALTGSGRDNAIGGFVARHEGNKGKTTSSVTRFIKCVNNGSITTAYQKTPTGVAAGFVAYVSSAANASFEQCFNRADITAGTFNAVGGLVGYFGDYATNVGEGGIKFQNCANYGDLVSTNIVAGLLGTASCNSGYANGKFLFLNCANYGELSSFTVTNAELVARVVCNATAANACIAFSNCWTRTSTLNYFSSKMPEAADNQNSSIANATALTALNAVAGANPAYLAWTIGETGRPELTEGAAGTSGETDPDPIEQPVLPSFTLTVMGEPANLGAPTPSYGTHSITQSMSVAVSFPDAYLNEKQTSKAVLLAWAAIANGDPVAYGFSKTGSFTMPSADTILAYNVEVSNKVTVVAGAHGSVTGGSDWYATGATVSVTATADADYEFAGWTGDITGLDATATELTFAASEPRSLVANFSRVILPGEETALFVSVDGNDSAAGTFAEPLLTLSNAVARLGETGGKIIMGAGLFTSSDPVVIGAPIELIGAGTEGACTILRNVKPYASAHQNSRVLEVSNAVARVQNLVIENGAVGLYEGCNGGAGVLIQAGTVTNCVIRNCNAVQGSGAMPYGGGVLVNSVDALLTHSVVSNCTTKFDAKWGSVCGAGVHVANGGRVSDTLVADCRSFFETPCYEKSVGGIMLTEGTAENCTVINCWGSKAGGICAMPASKKTVLVVNCTGYDNEKRLKDADGVLQTMESDWAGTESCFVNCTFGRPTPAGDEVTLTAEETQAGAVTVPYAWLTEKGYDCSTPEKAKAAATQMGANGYMVWASYVADLVPTDPNSKLIATISIAADGQVTVDCEPKSAARTYRVLGKANLSDAEWTEKAAGHRFFKIGVSLP